MEWAIGRGGEAWLPSCQESSQVEPLAHSLLFGICEISNKATHAASSRLFFLALHLILRDGPMKKSSLSPSTHTRLLFCNLLYFPRDHHTVPVSQASKLKCVFFQIGLLNIFKTHISSLYLEYNKI